MPQRIRIPLFAFGVVVALTLIGAAAVRPPQGGGVPYDGSDGVLGTDYLGRDVLALVARGGAGLVGTAAIAATVSVVVGTLMGLVVASAGWLGRTVQWIVDLVVVIPGVLVVLIVISAAGTSLAVLVAVVTAVSAPYTSRVVTSLVRPLLHSGFAEVAYCAGESRHRVLTHEVLPVLAGPIATDAAVRFVGAVYLVSTASFVGAINGQVSADWAVMIQRNLEGITLNPWAVLAPVIAIATVAFPLNLLADKASRGGR